MHIHKQTATDARIYAVFSELNMLGKRNRGPGKRRMQSCLRYRRSDRSPATVQARRTEQHAAAGGDGAGQHDVHGDINIEVDVLKLVGLLAQVAAVHAAHGICMLLAGLAVRRPHRASLLTPTWHAVSTLFTPGQAQPQLGSNREPPNARSSIRSRSPASSAPEPVTGTDTGSAALRPALRRNAHPSSPPARHGPAPAHRPRATAPRCLRPAPACAARTRDAPPAAPAPRRPSSRGRRVVARGWRLGGAGADAGGAQEAGEKQSFERHGRLQRRARERGPQGGAAEGLAGPGGGTAGG